MKDITILLPIHKWDNKYEEMFKNAFESLSNFDSDIKLMLISSSSILNDVMRSITNNNVEIVQVVNNGSLDYCNQINLGITKCDTKWFSLFEIDDLYKKHWLKTVKDYITKEEQDIDVFLPIVEYIDDKGQTILYSNESVWAYGFSEKQGFLDNESLLEHQNYQTSGGVFKTERFKNELFFKDNIKVTFIQELLLRITYHGYKIMVIPKILYTHVDYREDSLFWLYKNGENPISEKEYVFWLECANKEFFFKEQRDLVYTE